MRADREDAHAPQRRREESALERAAKLRAEAGDLQKRARVTAERAQEAIDQARKLRKRGSRTAASPDESVDDGGLHRDATGSAGLGR